MSIREELILKVLAKEVSVVELAQQYGVSRGTIYKWLSRWSRLPLSRSASSRGIAYRGGAHLQAVQSRHVARSR